jgi:hypothetical protein
MATMAGTCALWSRRLLLQGMMTVAAGRAKADNAVAPATGWHKFSKQVAGYIDRGKRGPETCGFCHYFIDPDQCVIVEGPVSGATGWCNYGATTG